MITAALRAVRGATQVKLGYREYVLAILTLIFSVQYLDRYVLSILAQPIKEEFALSDAQMGLLTGFAFSIPYSLMLFPVGMLADRKNRRNLLTVAVAVWSCLTVVTGFVRTLWELMIARTLIAATEAFNIPNALSIISDHYGPKSRATVVGLYYGGPALGKVLGFTLIAHIAELFGWRAGFLAAGVPGLLLATLLFLTVREPKREGSGSAAAKVAHPDLRETLGFIRLQRSTVHLTLAMTLSTVISAGYIAWIVPFLMRSHGMSLTDSALVVSFAFGGMTALGQAGGGAFVDRLSRNGTKWYALAPACFVLMGMVFMIGSALVPRASLAVGMIALWSLPIGCLYGPVMGSIQSLVLPKMRGVVTSCFVISINLVGAGLGPLVVGLLSDSFSSWAGDRSLQFALAAVSLVQIWAILHFLFAARTLKSDMARAVEQLQRSSVPPSPM